MVVPEKLKLRIHIRNALNEGKYLLLDALGACDAQQLARAQHDNAGHQRQKCRRIFFQAVHEKAVGAVRIENGLVEIVYVHFT